MIWLVALGCFAVGVVLGGVFATRLPGNPGRVKELEAQIQQLQTEHEQYRTEVSEHFGTTAELVQQMTQSYRDVYQHLAQGAQQLCSHEVASKLLPAARSADLDLPVAETAAFSPPKDYAPRQDPNQKGALAEDFGLEKSRARTRDDLNL